MPKSEKETTAKPATDGAAGDWRRSPRLGIIGGGQLAKMTALAAFELGCEISILERSGISPALKLASRQTLGDWDDPAVLTAFAQNVDVLTLENEFVNAEALAAVEAAGGLVFPSAQSMRLVQDKYVQKGTFRAAGLPVPAFEAVDTPEEVKALGARLGWPLLLKARRNAYDGKGNFTLRSEGDLAKGWASLKGGAGVLFVEQFCPFVAELAVIITRSRSGKIARYPLVISIQENHVCREVQAPAAVAPAIARRALEIAEAAVESINGVGSFGIELFLCADGSIFVNEIAPRVHNTGHYTIEACECSQFENHVRAVLDWPLGSTAMVRPAAVMLNLLGDQRAQGWPRGVAQALAAPGAHLHLYGKATAGPGRKMGHITALGNSVAEAQTLAKNAAGQILFDVA